MNLSIKVPSNLKQRDVITSRIRWTGRWRHRSVDTWTCCMSPWLQLRLALLSTPTLGPTCTPYTHRPNLHSLLFVIIVFYLLKLVAALLLHSLCVCNQLQLASTIGLSVLYETLCFLHVMTASVLWNKWWSCRDGKNWIL